MRELTLQPDEILVFDIFLAGIVSMNLHPGTTRDKPSGRTMEECADIALEMIEMRRKVMSV